jgi:hypothetical protein
MVLNRLLKQYSISRNIRGGLYERGKAFPKLKQLEIIDTYAKIMENTTMVLNRLLKQYSISRNMRGGLYERGKAFPKLKQLEIIDTYAKIMEQEGRCTSQRLADEAKISTGSASKARKALQAIRVAVVSVPKEEVKW